LDSELVERAVSGDQAAFSDLYTRWASDVRRYVGSIVSNRWDAEDVTQDVFVKMLCGLDHYTPAAGGFSAWTMRVARNAAFDHLRRRRPWRALESVDLQPDDRARVDRGDSLRVALDAVTEAQREVLLLRLAGFTPRELSRGGHRTRGSVNVLYHRARRSACQELAAMGVTPSTSNSVTT
jgi:RNA polymerase sigma-70 factor, ECF subfamily